MRAATVYGSLSAPRHHQLEDGLDPQVQDRTAYLTNATPGTSTITGVACRYDPTITLVSSAVTALAPRGPAMCSVRRDGTVQHGLSGTPRRTGTS